MWYLNGSSPIVFNRLFTMSFLMVAASKIRLRPFSELFGSFYLNKYALFYSSVNTFLGVVYERNTKDIHH